MAGQPPETFGRFTLREIFLTITAASRLDARRAWLNGFYARQAMHAETYPDNPTLQEADHGPVEDGAYVRAFFQGLAKRGNNGN